MVQTIHCKAVRRIGGGQRDVAYKRRSGVSLLINEYCPGLIRSKVLTSIADTTAPFITIWFSARIINEISGDRNITRLSIYVILTITIEFILSMIKNAMEKKASEKESRMWIFFQKVFSDKQMDMDFVDLENPEIHKKKQKAYRKLRKPF